MVPSGSVELDPFTVADKASVDEVNAAVGVWFCGGAPLVTVNESVAEPEVATKPAVRVVSVICMSSTP